MSCNPDAEIDALGAELTRVESEVDRLRYMVTNLESKVKDARERCEAAEAERDELAERLADHCTCGGLPAEADGSCSECVKDLNALAKHLGGESAPHTESRDD